LPPLSCVAQISLNGTAAALPPVTIDFNPITKSANNDVVFVTARTDQRRFRVAGIWRRVYVEETTPVRNRSRRQHQ
jgi:hypothetical protein